MYLMLFNDDTSSDVTTFKLAHQKGIIAFDKNSNTGFYMMHSTPGWPNLQNETLGYTSGSYGQHFLCINIDQTQLEVLGKYLYVTRPQIYWNSFDSAFLTSIAPTMKLVQDLKYNLTSNKILSQLVSRSGKVFQLYYKNSQSKSHLWPDLAQQFQENFQVETWLRDSDMRSFCGSYTVQMAGRVQYLNYSWKETTDHSKWGVSKSYACFSDINFQTSQQSRGGSALCFKDTKMAALFQSAIVELDQSLICCDSNSYTYITSVAPYNQDYQCAQCDLPSIQQLNLTIHPTMKQCLQCLNFVSRLTLTCVIHIYKQQKHLRIVLLKQISTKQLMCVPVHVPFNQRLSVKLHLLQFLFQYLRGVFRCFELQISLGQLVRKRVRSKQQNLHHQEQFRARRGSRRGRFSGCYYYTYRFWSEKDTIQECQKQQQEGEKIREGARKGEAELNQVGAVHFGVYLSVK
ncbi:Cell-death-related_nuclease 7 [Hexamita inflata]|uniref:Cell-death-related nuclease 7 n=1 Tax=Hexamita inflata TaxID=28002 RepID=A0AA86TD54_9EUKA|nr:Cell-death-related nuclease 7 [Hexamita inflata]